MNRTARTVRLAAATTLAATGAFGVAACTGPPAPVESTPVSPTQGNPSANNTPAGSSLESAGEKVRSAVAGSTIVSIEQEAGRSEWEVEAVDKRGMKYTASVSMSSGDITHGPTQKQQDSEDIAENKQKLDAKVDFREAAKAVRAQVDGGAVVELNLDDHNARTVWEADVNDISGTKHEVTIDAATGDLVSKQ